MKRIAISILLMMGSVGVIRAEVDYNARVQSWIGHTADELVQKCGYPTRTLYSPKGNVVYVYETSTQYQQPTYQSGSAVVGGIVLHGLTVGGGTYVRSCSTYFEMNLDNEIISANWRGNDCR